MWLSVKKSLLFSALALLVLACNNDKKVREAAESSLAADQSVQPTEAQALPNPVVEEPQKPAGPVTTMTFTEERYNFGKVKAGAKVRHTFKFKNTGKNPLVIANASSSCGCTVPTWPKEPIAPGKSGQITVEFDSAGKVGGQSKRVAVVANTDPVENVIWIEGEVEEAAAASSSGSNQ
jgi:Protein of unknown function (DUF1573)